MPSLYIDGEWVASADGSCDRVINPSDASVVAEVDVATDDQVRAAIAAARRAFDATAWPRTPTSERAALLDRVAGLIERDLQAMARLETLNTGKAMRESRWDMGDVARCSATTPTSPTRTPAGSSIPVTPTRSAASSMSRSACAR
jgi:betaine-aldehyde dehydrogenase